MPTYEYRCDACGYTFELFQGIHDEPETVCSRCGAPVRRIISGGAGVIFKGSGFYVTDSRKASAGGKEKQPTPPEKKPAESVAQPAAAKKEPAASS
jgi:putative FmdB family regulatory protein